MDTLSHPTGDQVAAAPRFAPGTSVGHFRVIGELGAGGMGIVFEAADPDLDRRVAIKVVRDREAGSTAGERLIREAKAMARLSHPNVVTVYEVGTVDQQVFLVMELIRGETLAQWLVTPRSWREIVAAFIQAGDGLAAAHHTGLVHRDFKPTNVLIDRRGRVRVSDFGLARDHDETLPPLAVGSPAGTPAYMAPEQRAGGPVDARADQYAFAVSLAQALAPAGRVPRRIRKAIAVATAESPDARYPALDDLLGELRGGLHARRWIALGGAVLGAAAVAALVATRVQQPAGDDCADGERLVDGLWNPAVRDAQATAFAAVRPHATAAIASTGHVLDEWAEAWRLGRRTACSAEAAPRAARLACLDSSLEELRVQLAAWARADRTAVDHAPSAAMAMPDPAACAHRTTGAASPWQLQPLLARASAVRAAHRAGHARDMETELAPLLAAARASGDPRAIASALLSSGTIKHASGDLAGARSDFAESAVEAGRAGDDDLLFDALRDEAIAVTDLGRPNDALGLLDAAAAVGARAGLDREWELGETRGNALVEGGRVVEGITVLEHTVGLLEPRAHDPKYEVELSTVLDILATAKIEVSAFDEAAKLMRRAVAIKERLLGPEHPELGKAYADLAEAEANANVIPEAERAIVRAHDIFVAAYGPDHMLVAQTEVTRANVAARGGRLAEAIELYAKASAGLVGKVPADSTAFASIETGWAVAERNGGHCDRAIPHFERAFQILDARSPNGATIGGQLIAYAECLGQANRVQDAYRAASRSLAELEQAKSPPDELAETWVTLADLEQHLGHKARAIELARRMLDATATSTNPDTAQMRDYERKQLAAWTR